jgi:catechol 2,3-dioxygenase-like lactoylglutathione lyase family enzyme
MVMPRIEHVNVTVSNSPRTAELMQRLFGWTVRWQGPAQADGHTVHVGSEGFYLALWSAAAGGAAVDRFAKGKPLNHIGVEVEDLDATEARVIAAGLTPFSHGEYEPGRRFYFFDPDGIEFEVVSYSPGRAIAAAQ